MWEKHYTPPPPPNHPTFEIQNQNKGIEDIMDIDSNCPHLLFGETTSHLTSKWRGTFQYYIFFWFNVEDSIKREMRRNCFSKIKKFKQHSINIKNYTAHPHDLVYVPAKFRENTAMRFWVPVRKLNVTDGGRCNISRPGPSAPREIKKERHDLGMSYNVNRYVI